ncbi:MAG: hypothetical protein V2A54_08560 [Bacteroidota bacterium]
MNLRIFISLIFSAWLFNPVCGQVDNTVKYERKALYFMEDRLINRNPYKIPDEIIFPCKVIGRTHVSHLKYFNNLKMGINLPDSAYPSESTCKPMRNELCKKIGIDTFIYPKKTVKPGKTAKEFSREGYTVYNKIYCRREFHGNVYVAVESMCCGCYVFYIFKMDISGKVLDWVYSKECI